MVGTKGIPDGYHSITAALCVKNCASAIEFYQRAFGAQEVTRMTAPDGKIAHAELKIGDGRLFVSDEFDIPGGARSPQTLGGSTGALYLYVPDVDAVFQQAVKAGARVNMPVGDMFWGDRYGQVRDPFGQVWGIATRQENVTPEELEERTRAFYAKVEKTYVA